MPKALADSPTAGNLKTLVTSHSTGSLDQGKRPSSSPSSSLGGSWKSGFSSRPGSVNSYVSENSGFHRRPPPASGENTKGSYSLMCWRDTTDDIRTCPHRGLRGSMAPPSFQRALMMPDIRKSGGSVYCS
mmetsp:Transcript_52476/g.122443  ORF Transcript_52476/g.122443 Transcript_52476/m.122443 type:complete len:130 (-) Transcript_52476:196-585(-)